MNLLTLAVGAPLALATTAPAKMVVAPRTLIAQANFSYGSGGSTVNAYLQTSIDGGATWIDIAQWSFATTTLRSVYNLNAMTAVIAPYTATDGALGANTAVAGLLGSQFRVKYVTAGTYAGTSLAVDIETDQAA